MPRLNLFGGFALKSLSGGLVLMPTRRSEKLLAMIVRSAKGGVARERAAETLYPEGDPQRVRHSLATELWRMRRALDAAGASAWLVDRGGRLSLAEDAMPEVDVVGFLRAAEAARNTSGERRCYAAASAADLYTGEFMHGHSDEWCVVERGLMQARWLDCIEILLDAARADGDANETIRLARALVTEDPYHEPAHRALIEAQASRGDRAAALETYRGFERRLIDELDVLPAPETQRLISAVAGRVRPRATSTPLRSDDRTLLGAAPVLLRRIAQALESASPRPRQADSTCRGEDESGR